jgi:hypothetical protein
MNYLLLLFNIDHTFNLTSSSYLITPSIVIISHVHDTVFHVYNFFSQEHQQKRIRNEKNTAQPKGTMSKLFKNQNSILVYII